MDITTVEIRLPAKMAGFIESSPTEDAERGELIRNALMLWPYIRSRTISHGKAAELMGIRKWDLITFTAISVCRT